MIVAPWPLTGRTAQLEDVGRLYRAGACGGIVLQGPAGVGKTRLAEEAVCRAERAGRQVERAVGHSATRPIPLGELVAAHLADEPLAVPTGPRRVVETLEIAPRQ